MLPQSKIHSLARTLTYQPGMFGVNCFLNPGDGGTFLSGYELMILSATKKLHSLVGISKNGQLPNANPPTPNTNLHPTIEEDTYNNVIMERQQSQ